jgi:hypothetical protein
MPKSRQICFREAHLLRNFAFLPTFPILFLRHITKVPVASCKRGVSIDETWSCCGRVVGHRKSFLWGNTTLLYSKSIQQAHNRMSSSTKASRDSMGDVCSYSVKHIKKLSQNIEICSTKLIICKGITKAEKTMVPIGIKPAGIGHRHQNGLPV